MDVIDLQTNTTTSYSSIREAARNLEMAHSTIRKYSKMDSTYLDRYKFKLYRVNILTGKK